MSSILPTMYTASEARAAFSALLDEAASTEVFIARHGKPAAVVMAADSYTELLSTLEMLEEAVLTSRAASRLQRIAAGEEATLGFADVYGEPQ